MRTLTDWLDRLLEGGARAGHWEQGEHADAAGTRSYQLYVPPQARRLLSRPLPLVVMLHGCGQDPADFARGTGMNALADEHGFFVLYPAQSAQANPQRCWNWFAQPHQQRDGGEPAILANMTRAILSRHAIDPLQVYVAGLSAGGAMAVILGTVYPDLFTAVGVHSGVPFAAADDLPSALAAMRGSFARQRAPGTPLPVIVFHGDQDPVVHHANAAEVIAQAAHGAIAPVSSAGQAGGRRFTRTVHAGQHEPPRAEMWLVHGLGHAWSGGDAGGSFADTAGPAASREMLRFFRTAR
jgi:poly(hydroxyalkanoate) depolymerase family esterase